MDKIYNYLFSVLLIVLVSGCFKEDEKVNPAKPGDVTSVTIEMTKFYNKQVYFDLSDNKETSVNDKSDFDLAFDSDADEWMVWLNTAAFMRIKNSGLNNFEAINDTLPGIKWKFDQSVGGLSSNALGYWYDTASLIPVSKNNVIVLDRGIDAFGNYRGFWKFQMLDADSNAYNVRYARLNGQDEQTLRIPKKKGVNRVQLSFNEGGKVLSLEPEKQLWDLLFTQYTTLLFTDDNIPYPYLVTGVLINPYGVSCKEDTLTAFENINRDYASSLTFNSISDEIGYDWKLVVGDVSTGNVTYQIRPRTSYIIRDASGLYFKLRFTGFYSNTGEKGYPSFEFVRL